jgi:hypothetical protein
VDVHTPDGVADAYLTRPDDGDRHTGVLFVIDAGVSPSLNLDAPFTRKEQRAHDRRGRRP